MSLTHRPPARKRTPEASCPRGDTAERVLRHMWGVALEGRVYRKEEQHGLEGESMELSQQGAEKAGKEKPPAG